MAKKKASQLGSWAFLLGVVLAVLFTFVSYPQYAWTLVFLGIVVGLLNITSAETSKFLFAGTALVIVGHFASTATMNIIPTLGDLFANLTVLFATSTIVVALKSVFELAKK
tara:strand:+ start:1238 stop:1570 length:333 start_codon:yes stop_codon:yes gene_type:complete